MERQYIGARYVPKFFENPNTQDATWLAGVAYEALTIVTFAGNSYTSKKPVPSGIGSPNLNREYWINTGNYNEQIESIQEEVDQISEDLEGLEEKTNAAREFILVGDSFGGGVDGNDNTHKVSGGGWIQRFKNTVEGWAAVYNSQEPLGGVYGFASSRPFLDVLQDAETNIPDKTKITDIVVLGGTNDIGIAAATVINKIAEFVAYCHTNYPKARVAIGCLGSNIYQMVQLGANAYSHCTDYGAEYISDLRALYCLAYYVGYDHVHLTEAGYAFYTPYINRAILTGKSEWVLGSDTSHNQITIISGSPVSSSDNLAIEGKITNNAYCLGIAAKAAAGVSNQGFANMTNASVINNGFYQIASQSAFTGIPNPYQRNQTLHIQDNIAETYFDDTGNIWLITRDNIPANSVITAAGSNKCWIPY